MHACTDASTKTTGEAVASTNSPTMSHKRNTNDKGAAKNKWRRVRSKRVTSADNASAARPTVTKTTKDEVCEA